MSRRFQGGIVAASYDGLKAPNAPTIGTASAGNQSVSLTFTAPSNVGGSNVSSYAVRVSPGGLSATGTSSPISVTGLTNDVQYTFDIAAINSYGFSPYSGTVTATPSFLAVEDVFSTYLYTSNNQTITNGVDLSGKGGMVWLKNRTYAENHLLFDTARGALKALSSNLSDEAITLANSLTAFNSNGFSIGSGAPGPNSASWTFRKAAKFFDVVTFTGNGTSRNIAHSLGVKPGFIIVKRTDGSGNWFCWARVSDTQVARNTSTTAFALNNTEAATITNNSTYVNLATATTFDPQYMDEFGSANANGLTYVAYLFAHDATADGIIQCGSYTGTGAAGNFVSLGWEPQWVLIKRASGGTGDWRIIDNMRGLVTNTTNGDATLNANTSEAEFNDATVGNYPFAAANPTGFTLEATSGPSNASGSTYIYIAIRRGPMKTPTVGTSVFLPSPIGATNNITVGFPADTAWFKSKGDVDNWRCFDRLRSGYELATNLTSAEGTFNYAPTYIDWDSNSVWYQNLQNGAVDYFFRRAPGFFDVVCYTGTGGARTVNHNLGVAPELMIVKRRNAALNWVVYSASLGPTQVITLNTSDPAFGPVTTWNSTAPTSTVFSTTFNTSGGTYVAYLFASCPGVSKVGSYTGNGSSQTLNCGFTTGARFFLVKRTDSTGDWWVWDSARGITAPADPALTLNTTNAEVTSADATDPDNSGIIVNQEATCNINVNGATYIFFAVS